MRIKGWYVLSACGSAVTIWLILTMSRCFITLCYRKICRFKVVLTWCLTFRYNSQQHLALCLPGGNGQLWVLKPSPYGCVQAIMVARYYLMGNRLLSNQSVLLGSGLTQPSWKYNLQPTATLGCKIPKLRWKACLWLIYLRWQPACYGSLWGWMLASYAASGKLPGISRVSGCDS